VADGLLSVLEANRDQLLRYLRAQGVSDMADDLLQELRIKLLEAPPGPVGAPIGYLHRSLTNLIIDRRRAETQRRKRDEHWAEASDLARDLAPSPGPDRQIEGQRTLAAVTQALKALPPRARTVLLRHRVDGETQRSIAASLGISQSTVESDLRAAYLLLHDLRRRLDEV
jgi:RNA polymerase sigma-70 factor (ECF subfamily)